MKYARPVLATATTLALLISACSQPQDVQSPTLTPQFGTADSDTGVDVALAPAGGNYVLSEQIGPIGPGDPANRTRVLLQRYDSGGSQVWQKQVASFDQELNGYNGLEARTVKHDPQGSVYALVGQYDTEEDTRLKSVYTVYSYTSAGNLKRTFNVGTTRWAFEGSENIPDMAVDSSGNTYVVLEKTSAEPNNTGPVFFRANVVRKYGTTGLLVWERTSSVGVPTGVATASDGSVYVAGHSGLAHYNSSGTLLWKKSGYYHGVAVSGSNVFVNTKNTVYRFHSSGQPQGSSFMGGLNSAIIQDLSGDGTGGVLVSGKYVAGTDNWNAFVRKLNATGNSSWTSTYGTPAFDDAQGVVAVSTREVYVTGTTLGSLAHTNRGEEDGYVRKLGVGGKSIWTR